MCGLTIPIVALNYTQCLKNRHFEYRALQKYNLPFSELLEFSNDLVSAILAYFDCDSLTCLTPAYVLTKYFSEFRYFSKSLRTELEYGYQELVGKYIKKEFGVFNKIIATEGINNLRKKSDCIRMRIGQYFMPTFVGNDTSNCSKYDEIIHSFSDQPVDPGIDWTSLCVKLTITLALAFLNYLCFKLILQEWEKTQELYQLQFNGIPLSQIEKGALSDENSSNPHQPLEESREITKTQSREDNEEFNFYMYFAQFRRATPNNACLPPSDGAS
ncbi:unnamed protein product [Moneuplotes crassus]|uniref:Uncharacterized protein n=1 Tax=Euplotes crassus TaxID=5936 RepID=A0AAD1XHL6_EUPCR|nr:unnamed protein product [Moneuplotes crassus]